MSLWGRNRPSVSHLIVDPILTKSHVQKNTGAMSLRHGEGM